MRESTEFPADRHRLLVIDDEPSVLRVLKLILGREYDVVTESSAVTALNRIVSGEQFDLIFSDLMMPQMNGMALLEELSRVAPAQASRVIFLTGGAPSQSARDFIAATRHERIDKPFETDEILALAARRLASGTPG
jgi:CheY-like chemotaxis protein